MGFVSRLATEVSDRVAYQSMKVLGGFEDRSKSPSTWAHPWLQAAFKNYGEDGPGDQIRIVCENHISTWQSMRGWESIQCTLFRGSDPETKEWEGFRTLAYPPGRQVSEVRYGDIDKDGDVDMAVKMVTGAITIYENLE